MTHRRTYLLIGIGILAVAGLLAGAWLLAGAGLSGNQPDTAKGAPADERSRAIAAAATTSLATDPERAILLAVESSAPSHTFESEAVLRRALAAPYLRLALHAGEGAGATMHLARYAPDAKTFLTVYGNTAGTAVRGWDVASGKQRFELHGYSGAILLAGYSQDGTRILTAGSDRTLRLWSADGGQGLITWHTPAATVTTAEISPDGAHIAAGVPDSAGAAVRIWDTRQGAQALAWHDTAGQILKLHWSPDSRLLLVLGSDGATRLWDVGARLSAASTSASAPLSPRLAVRQAGDQDATFAPDGSQFATTGLAQGGTRTWNADTGQMICALDTAPGTRVQFSPDGKRILVSNTTAGVVSLWEATPPDCREVIHTAPGNAPGIISADGRQIAIHRAQPDNDNTPGAITLLTMAGAGAPPLATVALPGDIGDADMQFSPDSHGLLTFGADGMARLWSTNPDGELPGWNAAAQAMYKGATYKGASFSPRDTYIQVHLATASDHVIVWPLVTDLDHFASTLGATAGLGTAAEPSVSATCQAALQAQVDEARRNSLDEPVIQCSPDGVYGVVAASKGALALWNIHDQRLQANLPANYTQALEVIFSPDSRLLAVIGQDAQGNLAGQAYLTHLDDLLALARTRVIRALTCAERRVYLNDTACQ